VENTCSYYQNRLSRKTLSPLEEEARIEAFVATEGHVLEVEKRLELWKGVLRKGKVAVAE